MTVAVILKPEQFPLYQARVLTAMNIKMHLMNTGSQESVLAIK
jgi:hypothetical protein